MLRALAFRALCERKTVIIYDGELIVGEKGCKAKAAPTYPELCRHVPANKPENFWQSVQMYWFVHISVISELNTWDAFSPGMQGNQTGNGSAFTLQRGCRC